MKLKHFFSLLLFGVLVLAGVNQTFAQEADESPTTESVFSITENVPTAFVVVENVATVNDFSYNEVLPLPATAFIGSELKHSKQSLKFFDNHRRICICATSSILYSTTTGASKLINTAYSMAYSC